MKFSVCLPALLMLSFVFGLSACGEKSTSSAEPNAASTAIANAPPGIVQIYNRSCTSCHGRGSGGAPRTGDAAAWQARVAQGKDVLLDHTISGYKGMPPMGMCMDCDESQFIGLIEMMAGASLAK